MELFRGCQDARIDEKGRLKMPSDFKRLLDEEHGTKFYITSRDGEKAEIFPMKEWEKIEEQMKAKASSAAKSRFLSWTNFWGQVVEMDQQGRLLLPQKLREKANLKGDVGVIGQFTYFHVVNAENYEAKLDAERVTDEDIESLGIDGL